MAISFDEFRKKNKDKIDELQNAQFKEAIQSRKTSQTTQTTNKSAKELKKEFQTSQGKLNTAKSNLKTHLEDSGVVTSNQNSYSAPNLFTIRNQQLKDSLSGKRSLLENDAETVRNLEKTEQENVKKYQETINTDKGKELTQTLKTAKNEEAYAHSSYQSQKAAEDWENASKAKRAGIIAISPLRNAMEVLNLTNNRTVQNEDGSSYTLPSYSESLDSYINENAGTVGKIVNSVGGQVGKRLAASALNRVLPGVGTAMYNVDIFENQYNSAMRQGYNQNQATAYATLGTVTEFATQKVLGAGTGLFKGQGDFEKSIGKILQNVIKSDAKNKVVSSMVSEGVEEFLQEYVDIFNRNLTLDEDNEYFTTENLENAVYSALIGALSGGLGETQTQIRLGSVNRQANQIIYDIEKANNTELSNINKTKISNIVHSYYLNNDQLVDPKSVVQSYMNEKRTKIDTLRDSAVNSGLDINNTNTVNMLNTLTKLIDDRDYDITFDSTIGDRVNGVLIDGQTIKINPNSENAIETIAVHEVTHSISTDTMRELVEDYAKKHPDYKKYIDSKKKDYNTTELTDELLADVSGQLFGNQEFINMLSNEEPSTFRKVYNAVISVANKITGNSNTFLFTQDLKNKWENAYRNQNNNLNNEVKYSTIGLKGAKNLTKNSNSRYYKNLLNNQKNAREIFNSNDDLETNNIKSKQETGWFKTKFGDWATIISDKDSEVVATLEPNKSYKLGNILKHDLLYDAYPELKKLKIITSDINMAGGYATFSFLPANTITDEIYIRNSDINKKDFRKVLLHEINHYIQHKENYDKQSRGSNSSVDGKESYRNNLGEIISNETKINADLTQNDLDAIILPEQAKSNPKYENIKDNLLKSNRNDLKDGEGKNALQNMELSVQNKIKTDKMGDKEDNKNSRVISDIEELDNSSFSLKEQGANNFIKDNFKVTGTRTYSKDIKVPESTDSKLTSINNTDISFSDQVDNVLKGKYPKRDMLILNKNTPQILQDIGLKNLPITMTQKHLYTMTNSEGRYRNVNYHNIPIDIVRKLPEALERPLNILKSDTKDDSIVVVTELADANDDIIVASIKLDGKGTIQDVRIDSNVMTSAYGKSGNYDYFMQDNIAKGNLLYDIDKGIIQKIDTQKKSDVKDRFQLPMRDSSSSTTSDIPKNISPISYDNNTTTLPKSQNVLLPTNSNMQNSQNDTKTITSKSIESESVGNKTAQLLEMRPLKEQPGLKAESKRLYQLIVDKGKYVADLAKKTGNKELYAKYDQMGTARGTAEYSIGVEQVDNKGQKIGKSLVDIWQPITESGKEFDFSMYLLHKHNIDRYNQGKPVFGEEITSDISKEEALKYEQENPEFIEWSKDINTYERNLLQNLVDAGITSEESQKYYNDTYSNYVRIYRDITGSSPITIKNGSLKVNNPIKKAKGGNQDILPLKDSMAQQTLEVTSAIRRNEFGLELLNTLGNGENITEYGKDTISKNDDGTYSFTVFKDGQSIKMEIDEGLYESIKPTKTHLIENTLPLKATRKLLEFQRGLITDKNPLFLLRNFFKDLGDAPINSKYGKRFLINFARAYHQIATNGEYSRLYEAMGGYSQSYFNNDKGLKLPKTKYNSNIISRTWSGFVGKIQALNHAVETAPRLAEFISTLEAGETIQTAMYNAAEVTTNFKRGGEVTKVLNRNFSNFLNASVQGFDKQFRNFTGQNGAKGYVNLLLKATIFGIAPSVLNHLLLDDDEDYEELPSYIKDNYYLFKTDDDTFIRIPKGRVAGVFGNAAYRTLEYLNGDKDAYKGFISNTVTNVAPNNPIGSNVLSPFIQLTSNTSWNGSDIVPERLLDLPAEEQFDEKTDELSKLIGKIFNISPKKINYLIDQYSGVFGDTLLPITTPQAESNPLKGNFVVDSVITNKYSSDFYDLKDQLTKNANSVSATDEDILKNKYFNSIQSEISELYKEKREIQMSDMKDSEKLKNIKAIQSEINDIAENSIKSYDRIEKTENFATIDDMNFYKNKDGEWIKISSTDKSLNLAIDASINMEEYIKYKNTDFVSDKDENGKSISNSRKNKVISYINNLNLSVPEKAIIIKMEYPSFDNYNQEIASYIDNLDIGYYEKTAILEELGFTISDGKVYW